MRSLFCMASNDISGGNKVFREWMKLLVEDGQEVHCYVWDKRRQFSGWSDLKVTDHECIEKTADSNFDFVFFANAFLVPTFLPFIGKARPVMINQAYESFHYGKTYVEAMKDKNALSKILQLPVAMMAISHPVQNLLQERVGVSSYYVPFGIESHFYPRSLPEFAHVPKRILMVGSYLSPWKGMQDGFDAIEQLSKDMAVQLVLITQPSINRQIFEKYNFPIEFHCRPALLQIPEISASCHAYLCASWHEGFGMASLECMTCGIPVVSTKNDGVMEFGKNGVNILLAEKNNPDDLATKLKLLFSNRQLYDGLRKEGFEAVRPYNWDACLALFKSAQSDIFETFKPGPTASQWQMLELLKELEAEGLHTPLKAYVDLNSLDKKLHALCDQLVRRELEVSSAIEKLQEIRDELKPYVLNEKAEYHDSFKAPFDLCRLLLSLKDEPQFIDLVATISKRQALTR